MTDTAVFLPLLPALASGEWSVEQHTILAAADPAQLADWFARQELGGLAYLRLKEAGLAEPVMACLATVYWQAAAAAAVKLDLLARLQTAFAAAPIETVLLKGMAFCLTLYPDPAMRPMNDLDFWLRPSDISAAWKTLEAAGLQSKGLWPDPTAIPDHVTQLDFYPTTPKLSPFNVEIHWDLSQRVGVRGRLPLAKWWDESQAVSWRGQPVQVLSPAAALVHTAVHQMLEHRGELRWRWLLDIDHIIRGRPDYQLSQDDWSQVLAEAQAAAVLPAVQAAVRLAAKWLGTPLPKPALAFLDAQAETDQQLYLAEVAQPNRSPAGKLLLNVGHTTGWRQKTAVVRPLLLPHPAYMTQRYTVRHKLLLPVYYLGRLAKGAVMALQGWVMPRK